MSCIKTPRDIIPYYINFDLPENKEMREKTIKYNKWYYTNKMNIYEKINIKAAYGFKDLFLILHLININFAKSDNIFAI